MKTILILMDSLNRNYLKTYNEEAATITPNICQFAKESLVSTSISSARHPVCQPGGIF